MQWKNKRNGWLILGVIFLVFFVGGALWLYDRQTQQVNEGIANQIEILEERRFGEEQGQILTELSDYLTKQVEYFVVTGESVYLKNYWIEIEQVHRREQIFEKMQRLTLGEQELHALEEAKRLSDELVYKEAWAMRLVAEAMAIVPEMYSQTLAAVELTEEETVLTAPEKQSLALNYIFGKDYRQQKQAIYSWIADYRSILQARIDEDERQAIAVTQQVLRYSQFINLAIALLTIVVTVCFTTGYLYTIIVRPFRRYAMALENLQEETFDGLLVDGSKDVRMFAEVFNQVYADWKYQKDKLEQEQLRFRIAVQNTSVVIFEYDVLEDLFTAFGSLDSRASKAANVAVEQVFPHFLQDGLSELVSPMDEQIVRQALHSVEEMRLEMPFLSYRGSGVKVWSRIKTMPLLNDAGEVVRVIGKITNITTEKEKEFELEEMRARDGLTRLYKKEIGLQKIREYLLTKEPADVCSILILDMDGFEQINQREGITFANAILQEVANILLTMTGRDDIQLRLGGDEFMLLVKHCDRDAAAMLGQEITEAIQSLAAQKGSDLTISASIGMCATESTNVFDEVYRCAESALKYAQANCPGQTACYLETSHRLGVALTETYPEQHALTDIQSVIDMEVENLTTFALGLLGQTKNLDDSLYLLLTRLGRIYHADRVSILEVDREYLELRTTSQWVRRADDLLDDKVRYLTREELSSFNACYDEEGLCQQYVLMEPGNETASILHSGLQDKDVFAGALRIEVWEAGHIWNAEQRKLLAEVTKVIASYLLKARADAISAAKSEFLSLMSHEIRTPMNAISGMTAIAKATLGDLEQTRICLDKIEAANAYLLSLVNDILDMSKIDNGQIELSEECIDVAMFVDELQMMMQPDANEKGLTLYLENQYDNAHKLLGDKGRLKQVLVNIVGNAIKYTPTGGKVLIHIAPERIEMDEIALKFSVKDTGVGIEREALDRIFNTFEQEGKNPSSVFGGIGLGLSISSRLVQLMGGKLEVQSKVGQGSIFYFTLVFPYAKEEMLFAEQTLANRRLLLVEDNALNREIMQTLLEMEDMNVEVAANGREAVEMFAEQSEGYYDGILMDIRMPVMDGFEAARQIRIMGKKDSRTIPIIAMTADAFDEDSKKALSIGMDGYLSKPLEVETVLAILETTIAQRK